MPDHPPPRPTPLLGPLSPEDGPRARFAIALRELRDDAGFDAPPIDVIAARYQVSRSSLHHALRGQRIPTVPVLAALVRAWGGDEAYWLRLRTATEEEELERERLAVKAQLNRELDWTDPPLHVRELIGIKPDRAEVVARLFCELADLGDPDAIAVFDGDRLNEQRWADHQQAAFAGRVRSRDAEARAEAAAEWGEWLERAGCPDIRTIAGYAGLSSSQVAAVLGARTDPVQDWQMVEKVFTVLQG
ncbi:helix-turn-helix transcriptional regulator [Streptomyces avermitilis]|uniref:helix-turn-helix domain-containing protein n=1 Tax=Streptomyces avermitilis TaxID=33903 RepID=UPI0033B8983D